VEGTTMRLITRGRLTGIQPSDRKQNVLMYLSDIILFNSSISDVFETPVTLFLSAMVKFNHTLLCTVFDL